MRSNDNMHDSVRIVRTYTPRGVNWLVLFFTGTLVAASVMPHAARAEVALVVVDVVAVADGYRASKLTGTAVLDPKNEKLGTLDDFIIGKDRVLFAILQVGGFLGLGSYLIAVPYKSLEISEGGKRIVLPGATRESVKALPEFKYR